MNSQEYDFNENKIIIKNRELSYEVNEEMKVLRTNIQFSGSDTKVIVMTSCIGGEGKSTTSMNLAIALADLHKKVVLIDADLRKSVMATNVEGGIHKKGLAHFLAGQASIAEVLLTTNIRGLNLILAGNVIPPNPAELLSNPLLDKTLQIMRNNYDYIIIDAPPLGLVVDAAILARVSDGAILVMKSGEIKYRYAQGVKEQLANSGCKILGVVLNKVDYKKQGRYYGRCYGKYYGKYYEEEDLEESSSSSPPMQTATAPKPELTKSELFMQESAKRESGISRASRAAKHRTDTGMTMASLDPDNPQRTQK